MRIRLLPILGAALFLALYAPSTRAHDRNAGTPEPTAKVVSPPPVQVTMIGEIIDPQCYFTHAARGKEHASCARTCARGGQDLAFLDEKSGRVYPLVARGHGQNPNDTVLALAGERARVSGTVYRIGQDMVLAIENATATTAASVRTASSTTAVRPTGDALPTPAPAKAKAKPKAGEFAIEVTPQGFVPATVTIPAGQPAVLVFTRRTNETCATEAVFSGLNRKVDLPLNRPVRVALGPQKAGRIDYACAMDMVHGAVVVR